MTIPNITSLDPGCPGLYAFQQKITWLIMADWKINVLNFPASHAGLPEVYTSKPPQSSI